MMPTRSSSSTIEPEDLLERLRAGLVYRPAQADRAQQHFFTVENLTALREIALRRCADRTATSQTPHACWETVTTTPGSVS